MDAQELLRQNDLAGALAQLQEQVRKQPANAEYRVFLFQLLAVTGQWDRALTQLEVVGEMQASALPMVQTCRVALRSEVLREQVFAGQRSPMVFGEPEPWVALLVRALQLVASGEYRASQEVREQAFEQAAATAGSLNDTRFAWVADADVRLGPVLEAIINGNYYWIPFHRIARVEIEPPEDLRDLVWMPAQFVWANGGESVGLVPSRYPGSHASADAQVALCRKTEWEEHEGEVYIGHGQRILTTDIDDYPILDVRKIEFDSINDDSANPPS